MKVRCEILCLEGYSRSHATHVQVVYSHRDTHPAGLDCDMYSATKERSCRAVVRCPIRSLRSGEKDALRARGKVRYFEELD